MKQEKIDVLMEKIDKRCKLPKHWDEFIKKESKLHHLIIKDRKTKELYCTNCNETFEDKSVKVRDYIECPHCKQKSEVFGMNYYRKAFEKSVILVQRMNKQVIIRVFEIFSYFDEGDKNIKKHSIEYARIIPGIGKFIGNNVYIGMFGGFRIYHGYKKLSWSKYNGKHDLTHFATYPYSKKRLLKGTNMQYAPIDEFLDRLKDEGRQQGNCVGHLYLTPYIEGKTEIYFIRKLEDVTKSFITLEYKENEVVQKELPSHSTDFKQEHLEFIDKWLGYRKFIDNKIKYQKPKDIKIIKYDLNKMVA